MILVTYYTNKKKPIQGPSFAYHTFSILFASVTMTFRDLYYQHGLTLIPAWIRDHMPCIVWNEITNPFPNINDSTVEVWEWRSDFKPNFMMDVITYPCRD